MPKKIKAEGYVCLGCGKEFFNSFGSQAFDAAWECEKRDAVRWAHEAELHAWYCTTCKSYYKGELNDAKCPKCERVGRRICRADCRGSLIVSDPDYDLIDEACIGLPD